MLFLFYLGAFPAVYCLGVRLHSILITGTQQLVNLSRSFLARPRFNCWRDMRSQCRILYQWSVRQSQAHLLLLVQLYCQFRDLQVLILMWARQQLQSVPPWQAAIKIYTVSSPIRSAIHWVSSSRAFYSILLILLLSDVSQFLYFVQFFTPKQRWCLGKRCPRVWHCRKITTCLWIFSHSALIRLMLV